MNNFSNSGYRVQFILQKINKLDPKQASSAIWAEVFNLDKTLASKDPYEVNQKLLLLRHEITLIEEGMRNSPFSEALYQPYINQLKECISGKNHSAGWENYRAKINAETMLALKYWSEILKPEKEANLAELEKLLEEIEKFKKELKESEIKGVTYTFTLNQINIIEEAIKNYHIAGGAAIKKAFKYGFSEIVENIDELDNESKSKNDSEKKELEEIHKNLGKRWKQLQKAGQEIVAANKAANAIISILSKSKNFVDYAANFLPPA